jgi:uracil-DNA glycosylase
MSEVKLHESWLGPLGGEFEQPYMKSLRAFLLAEKAAGQRVFPKGSEWFRAMDLTPLGQVRVVILGQDPYHGAGQAHGLCFSVKPGTRIPPSLVNIYKEMQSDLGIPPARHGFLEHWAKQGVLLLNSVLTVRMGQAASHRERGWERFTDAAIAAVNRQESPIVFMLWGSYAQKKAAQIESIDKGGRHLVLKAPHPSPLSAHSGWFGCRHFSTANRFLESRGLAPIDWALPTEA